MRHPILRPATLARIAARAVASLSLGVLSLLALALAAIGAHDYGAARADTIAVLIVAACIAAYAAVRIALPQDDQL